MNEELKQAYAQLDDAIRTIAKLSITPDGIVADFAVAVAIVGHDANGNMFDGVEPILPDGGRYTPRYMVTGLLKELIVKYDAVAGADIVEEIFYTDDGDDDCDCDE